jgi:hypothetical protein
MEQAKQWLKNRYVQIALALGIGITVGVVFYPSKTIERKVTERLEETYKKEMEKLEKEYSSREETLSKTISEERETNREYKEQTSERISSLTRENRQLRESSKKKRFKLVKPDGTVIEREYEETNREEITEVVTEIRKEFDQKISDIEERWKRVYVKRIKAIREQHSKELAEKEKTFEQRLKERMEEETIKVGEKKLGIEVGITTDKEYHVHGMYDIWGPIFIGAGSHFKEDKFDDAFIGIGVRL